MGCIRRVSLGEFFKHRPRDEAAGTGDWVVGFVPEALVVDISEDVEEVALFEGELVRSLGTVPRGRADDTGRWRQTNCGPGKSRAGDGG